MCMFALDMVRLEGKEVPVEDSSITRSNGDAFLKPKSLIRQELYLTKCVSIFYYF